MLVPIGQIAARVLYRIKYEEMNERKLQNLPVDDRVIFERNKVQMASKPAQPAELIARVLSLGDYTFTANGVEYALHPVGKIMQGKKCLGVYKSLKVRGNEVIIKYTGGDKNSSDVELRAVVVFYASKNEVAYRQLSDDYNSYRFRIGHPSLFDTKKSGTILARLLVPKEEGRADVPESKDSEMIASAPVRPYSKEFAVPAIDDAKQVDQTQPHIIRKLQENNLSEYSQVRELLQQNAEL